MADSRLQQLAKTDRNPVEETEYQNLLKQQNAIIQPIQQDQNKLIADTRAREDAFLGRVQGIPDALRGIENEVGLPGARATYQSAGEGVRDVSATLRAVPGTQQTIAKQVGISAPRLQQRIGAETAKLQPVVESTTRGLEEAQAGLAGTLSNFQTRAENVLAPFQIEAGILGESVKNQFELFKSNTKNALDREIAMLQESGLNDRAALQRANELAKQEAAIEKGSFQDLGDRVIFADQLGNILQTYNKGKLASLGSTADGW